MVEENGLREITGRWVGRDTLKQKGSREKAGNEVSAGAEWAGKHL